MKDFKDKESQMDKKEDQDAVSTVHLNQFIEHLHALRMFSINIVE